MVFGIVKEKQFIKTLFNEAIFDVKESIAKLMSRYTLNEMDGLGQEPRLIRRISSTSPQLGDKRTYRVYENERIWLGTWSGHTAPGERDNWSDVNGNSMNKEDVVLDGGWEWEDLWHIEQEWEYAIDFRSKFHSKNELLD